MLAGELALAGIDVAIVERRASQELAGSRAGGLHSRTIEVLDQRGIADRFLSQGQVHPVVGFHLPRDISDFPTRHNYVLALRQNHIERILAGWVGELAVPIYRERDVTGFTQDGTGVDVELSESRTLHADYLVGCDGGRSVVRKTAGIEFPGWDPTTSWLIAEVEWSEEPEWGFRNDALGRHALGKMENANQVGIVLTERQPTPSSEPTLRDISEALIAIYGTDYGIHSPTWISRFTDMTRQAATYRERRVLLAGDAAHVHPPVGGQGLNIGVQDAVNLGWKLAQVIKRHRSQPQPRGADREAVRERRPTADERRAEREAAYARNPDQAPVTRTHQSAPSALARAPMQSAVAGRRAVVPALLMKRPPADAIAATAVPAPAPLAAVSPAVTAASPAAPHASVEPERV